MNLGLIDIAIADWFSHLNMKLSDCKLQISFLVDMSDV